MMGPIHARLIFTGSRRTKSEKIYNIGIVVALIGICAVFLFKFVLPGKIESGNRFINAKLEEVLLSDLSGAEIPLSSLLEPGQTSYVLIFRQDECFGCIFNGVEDLKRYDVGGHTVAAIVVSDKLSDVRGWTSVNFDDFDAFFVLKKSLFSSYFHIPKTPAILEIVGKEVKSYRHIKLR